MTDNKTLIAYVSKGGVTEEAASVIANVLQEKYGFNVDVINLRKNSSPDIAQYSNVIVGCGVRMQKVYKEALNFLEKNDFTDRRVAIFLSSLEPKEEAESKYIKRILEK
jgi:menaquinone-dependent protoporphyrinogen IX oxidase